MRDADLVLAIILGVPVLLLGIIWLAMLIDICVTSRDLWIATGHDRLFNLFLLLALGPLGAILYGLAVRPQLERAALKRNLHRAKRAQEWAREPVAPAA